MKKLVLLILIISFYPLTDQCAQSAESKLNPSSSTKLKSKTKSKAKKKYSKRRRTFKKKKQDRQMVDLKSLNSEPTATEEVSSAGISDKVFKVYFDLALFHHSSYRELSFANFHSYLFLDVLPNADVKFSFDVSSSRGSPSFYELDWQANDWIEIRAGKIWLPFDDMDPHNLFGGKTNVSLLAIPSTSGNRLLPDLWTELGVGANLDIFDTEAAALSADLYITNGFGEGGTDPINAGSKYPDFAGKGLIDFDNNRDKAFGGRIHALFFNKLGVGGSVYTARWNDQSDDDSYRVFMQGVDAQFRLSFMEIRAGAMQMTVNLPGNEEATRGGFYGEFAIPYKNFKFLARGGGIQLDDRAKEVTDQTIIGLSALYRVGFVQYSLEHSRDILGRDGKTGKNISIARAIFEL